MYRTTRKLLFALIGLFATYTTHAASVGTTQLAPTNILKEPTLSAASIVVATPKISGFSPAGSCVDKGATLVVQGSGFGTQTGRGIALGGQGIHVDLKASPWSTTSITVTIPNAAEIQGGKSYYIGIEKGDHSQWLSNIDKTITICSTPVISIKPDLIKIDPKIATSVGSDTPSEPGAPPAAPPASASDVGAPGSPAPAPSAPAPSGQTPPPSSGSLLAGQLPPPPRDAPPAPPKESTTIEPAELVVVSTTMSEAQQLASQAQGLGLAVKRRSNLGGLGFVITVFRVPKQMGVGDALLALRQSLPNVWADANHRYQLMGDETKTYGQKLIGWNGTNACGSGVRIGLIDTAVDTGHAQLRGRQIQTREFLPNGSTAAPADHGTATAALLVGRDMGLVPGANIFAANIFRARDKEVDTTAEWVVQGLNWLAENRVSVINLSLGGPRNLLIEAAVQRLIDTNVAIVAAAGNGGESAPPVFPAAQSGVVAVTAVDADTKPYKRANRGDYISFSAPGVDVWTAAPGKDGTYVSGTSYATPFVTATLATARQPNNKSPWTMVMKQLQSKTRDLGTSGKDPVFGWGLVQAPGCGKVTASKR